MTRKQSIARLVLYVLTAMVTAASAGLTTVDFADWRQAVAFVLSILATGLVTARSYIDQTPNMVSDK
jgi:Trk-type K+ transport system membrane component